MKNFYKTHKPLVYFLLALLAVYITVTTLFVYGHFNDLSFAKQMYDPESFWARYTAGFGSFPINLCIMAVGSLLIAGRKIGPKWLEWVLMIAGGVIILAGGFLLAYQSVQYRSGYSYALTISVSVAMVLVVTPLLVYYFKDVDPKRLIIAAILIACIAGLEFAIGEIVKPIWSRTRPYFVFELEGGEAYFLNWYEAGAGKEIKSWMEAWGRNELVYEPDGFSDYFKSFPSGHTSHATLLAPLLTILLCIKESDKKWAWLGFLLGSLFGFGVAIGRTMMGAHYLTDTMAGFSVTLFSFGVVIGVYYLIKLFIERKTLPSNRG